MLIMKLYYSIYRTIVILVYFSTMVKNMNILMLTGGAIFVTCYIIYVYKSKKWYPSFYKNLRFVNSVYSINNYDFLGSPYNPNTRGSRSEPNEDPKDFGFLNEECLEHPGYRMCMFTDGTSGVCGTSGMCVPDMEVDVKRNWATRDDIKMPLCVEPIFKEGCQRFCRCKYLKGDIQENEMAGCIAGCQNMFYPLD
jgi:hypothetical protein